MELQFKNKHIFFALADVWSTSSLDYRFKYQVNTLVTANPDDEYIQTLNIDGDTLTYLFDVTTKKPEGIAAAINKEMLDFLLPQLAVLSQTGNSEVLETINNINNIVAYNYQKKVSSITDGKNIILS